MYICFSWTQCFLNISPLGQLVLGSYHPFIILYYALSISHSCSTITTMKTIISALIPRIQQLDTWNEMQNMVLYLQLLILTFHTTTPQHVIYTRVFLPRFLDQTHIYRGSCKRNRVLAGRKLAGLKSNCYVMSDKFRICFEPKFVKRDTQS